MLTRRSLASAGSAAISTLLLPPLGARAATTASGLVYEVVKASSASGGKPKVGDLVAIRFKGAVKESGAVFDDILSNPEPYYFRLEGLNTEGPRKVLPGVDEVRL